MKSFYVEVTADMDEPGDQVGCSSGLQLLQEPSALPSGLVISASCGCTATPGSPQRGP